MHAVTPRVVPPWLLKAKVTTPDAPAGHVARPALVERLAAALDRRFVVLSAPAGFGKTTALADLARTKRSEGVLVAWISVDEDDAPGVFGSYLASAFERGGLDLSALPVADDRPSSPVAYQLGMLASAIERHEAPCLLVLDEADRLPRETVERVQRLVEQGPANLRFALGFRIDPGFDLSMQILAGAGVVVGPQELRFSRAEIEDFFGGALSRRQLAATVDETAGWPVALTVFRNQRAAGAAQRAGETARLTADFVSKRLLRGLSEADCAFVCELAVFEWIDPDLVDEVLGSSDAGARMASLPPLDGLLSPIGSDGAVRRLHPLVSEACLDVLAARSPGRRRALHVGIAHALARRGQLLPALRQARSAGDARLVGELVEQTGVFDIWLRHGVPGLVAANEFLTPESTASYPRLLLLRGVVRRLALRVDEADALCELAGRATLGFTRDRAGGDVDALAVDRAFALVALAGGSHLRVCDELDTLLPLPDASADVSPGWLRLAARHLVLCGSAYERGRFDECGPHAARARELLGDGRGFGRLVLDLYEGMAAMARGRPGDAAACYARARRRTRRDFAADPCLAACVDALRIELDLECDRTGPVEPRTLTALAELRPIWADLDAAAIAVAAELTFEQQDAEATLRLLTKTLGEVRTMRSAPLSRFVASLLVSYLAQVGRTEHAASVWAEQALPDAVPALLDLSGQPWWTMESQACARVRLLAAQGDLAAAAEVAAALCAAAAERGLARTRQRGLALAMAVAQRAGEVDHARARLLDFLRLAGETTYVKPLVRDAAATRAVITSLLAAGPVRPTRDAAEAIIERLDVSRTYAPVFSSRELQVLAEMRAGLRNSQIAARLGISKPGVRFHLMNIYRKTRVSRRDEAVRAAESLGVLD